MHSDNVPIESCCCFFLSWSSYDMVWIFHTWFVSGFSLNLLVSKVIHRKLLSFLVPWCCLHGDGFFCTRDTHENILDTWSSSHSFFKKKAIRELFVNGNIRWEVLRWRWSDRKLYYSNSDLLYTSTRMRIAIVSFHSSINKFKIIYNSHGLIRKRLRSKTDK